MKQAFTHLVAFVIASLVIGCSTAPKNEEGREKLETNAASAMANFKANDPSLQTLLDKSVGYVIFPDIGKAGWIIGGTYGRGEVYEAGKRIGYADITAVSAGFQWGAQNFSELLIFLKPGEFDSFKAGNDFSLGANASAVALKSGAAASTDPSKGMVAVVNAKGGLMAEAAVGGQRIRFTPAP